MNHPWRNSEAITSIFKYPLAFVRIKTYNTGWCSS